MIVMISEVLPTANIWGKMPKHTASWPSLPPSSSPVPPIADITNPDGDFESQLDFFHRLGYSTEQIQAVRQRFGPNNNDRDKLLWELVKIAAEAQISPVTKMNVLVAKGDVQPERLSVMVPAGPGLSREDSPEEDDSLRSIVIDGSNVAMSHGNKDIFSCLGILLAVNFFLERGHTSITVIVPSWRNEKPRPDVPISDQHILRELEKKKLLVFTPSKRVAGKRVVCHDDRYIVRAAVDSDGVIVSNDLYRDLQREKPEWKRFIEERLLMYTFINNKFMPPEDPLGRHGPTLDNFLRKFPKTQKKQPCPYGNKCTYGLKCKFLHPERPRQSNQSLADELRTSQRHPPSHSAPPPGQSLSLVEDMAKMFLNSTPLQPKDHHQDHHPSRKNRDKKGQCEKEKNHKSQSSLEHGYGESALDSGLGSIDPQPNDLRDKHVGSFYGTSLYSYPQSAPCSQLSPSCHGFQHQEQTSCSDYPSYGMPTYPNYGPYSGGMQAYSHPHRLHRPPPQQMYLSDPFGANPRLMGGVPEEWDPNQARPRHKGPREVVRKKLLAIFSAPLVDKAMQLNPNVLDPQKLAGEILMLQSQGVAMS